MGVRCDNAILPWSTVWSYFRDPLNISHSPFQACVPAS
jgi:hypothetical protein